MKPSHVSRELRRIASKIDGSTNPSSKLVANDLKRVLAAMGGADQSNDEFESDKIVYCPICTAQLHAIGEDRWGCDNGHELEIFVLDENYG